MHDHLFTNARLITLDPRRPAASAMLIRGDRILAVGDEREILPLSHPNPTRIDLQGKTVTPGFIDCHLHPYAYGAQLLTQADLIGTTDIPDLQSRLADLADRRKDGWLLGWGFDQSKMSERRFVTRQDLDRVSKTRPILVSRVCGHAAVVNSAALALATPAMRRAGDESTGLYTETAIDPFYTLIPEPPEEEMEQYVLAAANVALKTGITAFGALLDTPNQMTAYSRLAQRGALPVRVTAMPPRGAVPTLHAHGIRTGFGNHYLQFGGAKFFSDGSLGAQTALLSQPYADKPNELGLRIYDPDDLKQKARDAQQKGFQVVIHAIGDQALRETLDAIEYALENEDNLHHRHRVEHASLTPPDCMERMAKRKIVVTAQPQFVTSDTWTPDRVGQDRARRAYPFKTMIEMGIPVGLSSDCPVEKLDAFDCLAAATGRHLWSPDECLTVDQALHAYTMGSAYANRVDHQQGSLEKGKLADFVVLSHDPRTLSPAQIRHMKAEQVYVGGRRVAEPA
jgi:predicted amidohydrolase YtcJ